MFLQSSRLTHAGVFFVGDEFETHEDVIVVDRLHVLDVIGEAKEFAEAEVGEGFHGGILRADEFSFDAFEA